MAKKTGISREEAAQEAQRKANEEGIPYRAIHVYGTVHGLRHPNIAEPLPGWVRSLSREEIEEKARIYNWIGVYWPETQEVSE